MYRREIALLILVIVQIVEVEVLTEVFWVVRRRRRLMLQLSVAIQTRQEEFELLPEELFTPPENEVGLEDQLQLRIEVFIVKVVEEDDDELLALFRLEDFVKYLLKLDLLPLVLQEVLGQKENDFLRVLAVLQDLLVEDGKVVEEQEKLVKVSIGLEVLQKVVDEKVLIFLTED